MNETPNPQTSNPASREAMEVRWFCRFHPTNWWHEVGCPHCEWTKEQLLSALIAKKRFEERDDKSCITTDLLKAFTANATFNDLPVSTNGKPSGISAPAEGENL
jgi:hypothetical protein